MHTGIMNSQPADVWPAQMDHCTIKAAIQTSPPAILENLQPRSDKNYRHNASLNAAEVANCTVNGVELGGGYNCHSTKISTVVKRITDRPQRVQSFTEPQFSCTSRYYYYYYDDHDDDCQSASFHGRPLVQWLNYQLHYVPRQRMAICHRNYCWLSVHSFVRVLCRMDFIKFSVSTDSVHALNQSIIL